MKSKMKIDFQYKSLCKFILIISLLTSSVAKTNYSIIIVGAGPSGIAAATRLQENGFDDIIIFEAENRLGGRINSVFFGDAFVDLGAQFCHGQENNIAYELAKNYNILKSTSSRFEMICSDGEKVDRDLAKELFAFVDLYEVLDRNNSDYYISIGDFFTKEYETRILDKYKTDEKKEKICKDAISTLESQVCHLEGCFSWFKPTLNNPYEKCSGDLALNWDGSGYKTILEIMMKRYPDSNRTLQTESKIFLNREIIRIIWEDNQTSKYSVKTNDGATLYGDHIIYTTSLGVLKEKHEDIFKPELPVEKKRCIETLGINAVMKMYLHFEQKWWEGDFVQRMFVWSEEDRNKLIEEFSQGPVRVTNKKLVHL